MKSHRLKILSLLQLAATLPATSTADDGAYTTSLENGHVSPDHDTTIHASDSQRAAFLNNAHRLQRHLKHPKKKAETEKTGKDASKPEPRHGTHKTGRKNKLKADSGHDAATDLSTNPPSKPTAEDDVKVHATVNRNLKNNHKKNHKNNHKNNHTNNHKNNHKNSQHATGNGNHKNNHKIKEKHHKKKNMRGEKHNNARFDSKSEKVDTNDIMVDDEDDDNRRNKLDGTKSGKSSEHHHHTHSPTSHHHHHNDTYSPTSYPHPNATNTPSNVGTSPPTGWHDHDDDKSAKGSKKRNAKSAKSKSEKAKAQKPTLAPSPQGDSYAPTYIPPDNTYILPDNMIYYDGFEKATFPDNHEWSVSTSGPDGASMTTNRDEYPAKEYGAGRRLEEEEEEHEEKDSSIHWALTKSEANFGAYSIKSPKLYNDDIMEPRHANVTLTTGEDWEAGYITFSLLWDLNWPSSEFWWNVDGEIIGWPETPSSETWEYHDIYLDAGMHEVTWEYLYPGNDDVSGEGEVFIDDVSFTEYVMPTYYPTMPPVDKYKYVCGEDDAEAKENHCTNPICTHDYEGCPDSKPYCFLITDSECPNEGQTSSKTPRSANDLTFAPTSIPDGAIYYMGFEQDTFPGWTMGGGGDDDDDVPYGAWEPTEEEANSGLYSIVSPDLRNEELTPANSTLTLTTNPTWGDGTLHFFVYPGVQEPFDHFHYFVDGVWRNSLTRGGGFEEWTIELGPGEHEIAFVYEYNPFGLASLPPEPSDWIGAAFIDDVYFVESSSNCLALDPNPDSFEDATFPSLPWSTGGAGDWTLTNDVTYTGMMSIKSPYLEDNEGPAISNATLVTCDFFTGGILQFKVIASVLPPRDIFIVYVDGEEAAQLVNVNEWTEFPLGLSPGAHRIDFSYQYNAFGVSPLPPNRAIREGAVWIDDVSLKPFGSK